jgi:hypothetical protein
MIILVDVGWVVVFREFVDRQIELHSKKILIKNKVIDIEFIIMNKILQIFIVNKPF